MKLSNALRHNTLMLCGGAALLASTAVDAAGLLSPADGSVPPLAIREQHVSVVIEDGYAITTVEQIFHNANDRDLEALYSFPIPEKAAVGDFTFWIDGKPVHAEVLKKTQAKQIYQEEKAAGRDAALTEQDGFKTFDIAVSPVRANNDVKIRLAYTQPAHVDTGIGRYVYPLEDGGADDEKLSFWTYNEDVQEKFSFDLRLRSGYPIDQLRLPQHPQAVITKVSEQEWSVHMESNNAAVTTSNGDTASVNTVGGQTIGNTAMSAPTSASNSAFRLDQDILLYWRLKPGLPGTVDVVSYKAEGSNTGTFMMTITPGEDLKPISEGRDWIFVLDYSGSMEGKYRSMYEGVQKGLQKLQGNDRFRVITFNDSANEITRGYVNATPENVNQFLHSLEGLRPSGSTNLYDAVALAMKTLEADRSSGIILVTDGVANVGVTEKKQFLQLLDKRDVRLFTFVMGNSADRPLLEGMAKISQGFAVNISNSDDIVGKILEATSKLKHEAMHDVRININGVRVSDLSPENIGSLYRGQQLIVFGHYQGSGEADVSVETRISGQEKRYKTRFDLPQHGGQYPELERLWAFAKIEDLQNKMDYLGADADTEQALTDIALQYGLVTDYTSMIVLREEQFAARGIDRRNAQRIETEHQARAQRQTAPVQNHRVDQQQPMYSRPAPSHHSGGGGDTGPIGVLLLLPLLVLMWQRKNAPAN